MTHRKFGWKPSLPDVRRRKYADHLEMSTRPHFPPMITHQNQMSPIEDQGQLGSCVAHAACGLVEFIQLEELKAGVGGKEIFRDGKFDPISRLYNYFNARSLDGNNTQDEGTTLSNVIHAMKKWGICRESIWPYNPLMVNKAPPANAYLEGAKHLLLADYSLDNTVIDELKQCLVNGYPFIFGMSVYESFMNGHVASTGHVPMPGRHESLMGGHALCCVGYDDANHAFIVRNSWGTSWGMHGYCYIPYDYLTNRDLASDFWTMRKE